ncbi:hypothetical protein LOAG_17842 [Loa loa]|uniref:Uncharacterized protein n=1 Tax=Loa loa TaxID=7209 RepID=A0A1S0UH58_LOALO|nr:hypothetical protein LOAG_17842 [Loa loa]EJD74915.1 hypothetical protein LOAG_17842 [Loa loa]
MVRRRFMSKGNATFVDGLDKTVLKEFTTEHLLYRTAILGNILNDVLDQEWDSSSRKVKGKEGRRRVKPIERTNSNEEELEYQRLLSEVYDDDDGRRRKNEVKIWSHNSFIHVARDEVFYSVVESEIREAEEYELIVEYDSKLCKDRK